MLGVSSDFKDKIKDDSIEVLPRVRMWQSWNHLLEPTVSAVDNTDIPYEEGLFPVESILTTPHRQTAGASPAIVGEAFVTNNPLYGFRVAPSDEFLNPMYVSRGHTIGSSITTSNRSTIIIDYGEELDMNVVDVQLESLRRAGRNFHQVIVTVSLFYSGNWHHIADDKLITAGSMGRLRLYKQSSSWSSTPKYDGVQSGVSKIRLIIHDTTHSKWHMKVRYFGGHMVTDVSDDIISLDWNKSENEQSSYLPYGEPTSNGSNIELDNTGQKYAFKPVGDLQPKLDKDMKFTLEMGLKLNNGSIEYIPQGTYYVDSINYDTEEMTLSMTLTDFSKFLQKKFVDDCYYEGRSLKFIVRDLLARTGFDPQTLRFDFGVSGNITQANRFPYVWFRSTQTVWDCLVELVKSEMGTVIITENEEILLTDRESLENRYNAGSQWIIDADVDLERADQDFTVDANQVKIVYSEVGPNIDQRGIVTPGLELGPTGELSASFTTTGPIEVSQALWEPAGGLSLGSAPLRKSIGPTDTEIRLDRPMADVLPESGEGNIEGEYISWSSIDVQPSTVKLNGVKRGLRGTVAREHLSTYDEINSGEVEIKSFFTYAYANRPEVVVGTRDNGRLRIEQRCKTNAYNTFTCCRPFSDSSTGNSTKVWGTTLMFDKMTKSGFKKDNMAGMFINANTGTWSTNRTQLDAYWIEVLSLTELADNDFAFGTIRVYRTSDDNSINIRTGLPPTEAGIHGFPAAIVDDKIPVKLEVVYDRNDGDFYSLYVNDRFVTSWAGRYDAEDVEYIPAASGVLYANIDEANTGGYYGVYVRGNTNCEFEYFYHSDNWQASERNPTVFDYRTGGFYDRYRSEFNFDHYTEFGSIMHEVRSFEVDHQVFPNRWASIFNSNELESRVIDETHTPFSSEFVVVNTSRSSAILAGNDNSDYSRNLGVNHQFFVYGNTVIEKEQKEVVVKNDSAIRRHGLSEVVLSNPWIQVKEKAESLGDWITRNWAEPVDFYTIDWFPNWAVQPGDRVQVAYEEKGFTEANYSWFVKSMNFSYDGGLSGTITLQRRLDLG